MKISFPAFLVLLLLPLSLYSQLTLETVNGRKRTKTIHFNTKIGLKLPTMTSNNDCNCCHLTYNGNFDSLGSDYIKINQLESIRVFVDEMGNNQIHHHEFEKQAIVPTNIPINSLTAVSVFPKSRQVLKPIGYTLLLLSTFQAIAINPFFDGKAGDIGHISAATLFTTGFIFSVLRESKTYYFEPINSNGQQLWRIKK